MLSRFYPIAMIVNRPNRDLIMAGYNKLYYFKCVRTHVYYLLILDC